ncbi:MAG: nucleotide exchange factor GrpE [Desulfobacterales bacterium]|nr:nucleotide exchange factor GrpE [Desulfobacterales bacterium]
MTGKTRIKTGADDNDTAKQTELSQADAEKIRAYEKMAGSEPVAGMDSAPSDVTPLESADADLKAELEAVKSEAALNGDRFLRVSADFENYKKRTARNMEDFRKYAVESLVKDMLPVVDNLERAIVSAEEDKTAAGIIDGVRMTLDELFRVFDKAAVKPIDAMGKAFDPAVHQAVMQEESEKHPDKTVIREFQKGYTIHGRLLRPAMVVVAKVPPGNNGDGVEPASKN